jgi:hypothetical protein
MQKRMECQKLAAFCHLPSFSYFWLQAVPIGAKPSPIVYELAANNSLTAKGYYETASYSDYQADDIHSFS